MRRAGVEFVTPTGARVTVFVEGETPVNLRDAVLDAQRTYGRMQWRTGEVPSGGFRFPLENEADFDWALLGARAGKITKDGEEIEGVWLGGDFYSKRVLEPTRQNKNRAIKYSRGARPTDPPEVVEGDKDSSFRYVTLVIFRGNGRLEHLARSLER